MDLNAKSEVAEKLKDDKEKLFETSTQVDYPISVDASTQTIHAPTIDNDVQSSLNIIDTTYADRIDDALNRLEQCKLAVSDR